VTIVCTGVGSPVQLTIDRVRPDWTAVWSIPLPGPHKDTGMVECEDKDADHGPKLVPATPVEQTIWNAAAGGDYPRDRTTITDTYAECAEHDDPWDLNKWPLNSGQAEDAKTMLMLCPNHPNAAAIRKRMAAAGVQAEEVKNGEAISDGIWRVGRDVKPGTYTVKTDPEGLECEWGRFDSKDDLLSGGSASGSKSKTITATIDSSDYEFATHNCGVWYLVK
jgi:hypothetical protein